MTQIDFYTGAADRLLIACRLCAKAVQQGLKTVVYVPDERLAGQFDKLLWTFTPTGFVPHCRVDNKLADVTPVIMNSRPVLMEAGCFGVLLNLDADVPPGFEHAWWKLLMKQRMVNCRRANVTGTTRNRDTMFAITGSMEIDGFSGDIRMVHISDFAFFIRRGAIW